MMHYSRSGEELAHEDAERPEVDRAVVSLVQDDLGATYFIQNLKHYITLEQLLLIILFSYLLIPFLIFSSFFS